MQVTLRPATAADDPFLYQLFEASYGQQFALLPLAPPQREALVRMQFEAQRTGYRQQSPNSQDFLLLAEGEPIGRLWLDEGAAETRVIDIVVAPAHQNRGFGTAVLEQLISAADRAGKMVSLSVSRMNPRAFEWYRRLGFEVCSENEMNVEMRRQPRRDL